MEEAPRLMRGFSYSYHPDIDGHLAGSERAREVWWTYPLSHPRTPCCVARWFSSLVLTAAVAQAQLPGLRRKLKDAGRQAATGQPAQRQPNFDNTVLELTPQVVTRLIAGLEARSRAVGPGDQTVADLRRRAAAASHEAAPPNNQH